MSWQLRHEVVGVGLGFNDHRTFIVDEHGDEVADMRCDLIKEITVYAEPGLREQFHATYRGIVTFLSGEPYPYSDNAKRIAAAGDES